MSSLVSHSLAFSVLVCISLQWNPHFVHSFGYTTQTHYDYDPDSSSSSGSSSNSSASPTHTTPAWAEWVQPKYAFSFGLRHDASDHDDRGANHIYATSGQTQQHFRMDGFSFMQYDFPSSNVAGGGEDDGGKAESSSTKAGSSFWPWVSPNGFIAVTNFLPCAYFCSNWYTDLRWPIVAPYVMDLDPRFSPDPNPVSVGSSAWINLPPAASNGGGSASDPHLYEDLIITYTNVPPFFGPEEMNRNASVGGIGQFAYRDHEANLTAQVHFFKNGTIIFRYKSIPTNLPVRVVRGQEQIPNPKTGITLTEHFNFMMTPPRWHSVPSSNITQTPSTSTPVPTSTTSIPSTTDTSLDNSTTTPTPPNPFTPKPIDYHSSSSNRRLDITAIRFDRAELDVCGNLSTAGCESCLARTGCSYCEAVPSLSSLTVSGTQTAARCVPSSQLQLLCPLENRFYIGTPDTKGFTTTQECRRETGSRSKTQSDTINKYYSTEIFWRGTQLWEETTPAIEAWKTTSSSSSSSGILSAYNREFTLPNPSAGPTYDLPFAFPAYYNPISGREVDHPQMFTKVSLTGRGVINFLQTETNTPVTIISDEDQLERASVSVFGGAASLLMVNNSVKIERVARWYKSTPFERKRCLVDYSSSTCASFVVFRFSLQADVTTLQQQSPQESLFVNAAVYLFETGHIHIFYPSVNSPIFRTPGGYPTIGITGTFQKGGTFSNFVSWEHAALGSRIVFTPSTTCPGNGCENGGYCNSTSGYTCNCQGGFIGARCETCPTGFYKKLNTVTVSNAVSTWMYENGPPFCVPCLKECSRYQSSGVCDPLTGNCLCPRGFDGPLCERDCGLTTTTVGSSPTTTAAPNSYYSAVVAGSTSANIDHPVTRDGKYANYSDNCNQYNCNMTYGTCQCGACICTTGVATGSKCDKLLLTPSPRDDPYAGLTPEEKENSLRTSNIVFATVMVLLVVVCGAVFAARVILKRRAAQHAQRVNFLAGPGRFSSPGRAGNTDSNSGLLFPPFQQQGPRLGLEGQNQESESREMENRLALPLISAGGDGEDDNSFRAGATDLLSSQEEGLRGNNNNNTTTKSSTASGENQPQQYTSWLSNPLALGLSTAAAISTPAASRGEKHDAEDYATSDKGGRPLLSKIPSKDSDEFAGL